MASCTTVPREIAAEGVGADPRQMKPDSYSWLCELAGLVVAGGPVDDDVPAVEGVDESDDAHQGGYLLLVVVLGGIHPGSSVTPPAASAMRVPCSVSSRAARSASVNSASPLAS